MKKEKTTKKHILFTVFRRIVEDKEEQTKHFVQGLWQLPLSLSEALLCWGCQVENYNAQMQIMGPIKQSFQANRANSEHTNKTITDGDIAPWKDLQKN